MEFVSTVPLGNLCKKNRVLTEFFGTVTRLHVVNSSFILELGVRL